MKIKDGIVTRKIMHLTDIHWNPLHRIPQSRTSRFHDQIAGKWENVCEAIIEEDIDMGIISGDTLHLKNPKIYYPEDIYYYARMIEKTRINWVSIPGNHDLPESSFDNLEKSPYNLLVKSTENLKSLATLIGDKQNKSWYFPIYEFVKEFPGMNLLPVNIHGYPYRPLNTTLEDLASINERVTLGNPGFNILLLHMDVLVDPNIFLFWPVAGYDTILDQLPNVDLICLGHIHQSFPVYKRVNPQTGKVQMVSKPWSFSRVAKDYFNKTEVYEKLHKPSYSVIILEQGENTFNVRVEYKEITCAPFKEAFKRETLKRQIENNVSIKSFLDQIKSESGSIQEAFKILSPEKYMSTISMSEEVRNCINKYLEEE